MTYLPCIVWTAYSQRHLECSEVYLNALELERNVKDFVQWLIKILPTKPLAILAILDVVTVAIVYP